MNINGKIDYQYLLNLFYEKNYQLQIEFQDEDYLHEYTRLMDELY